MLSEDRSPAEQEVGAEHLETEILDRQGSRHTADAERCHDRACVAAEDLRG
jgi:hypothetical protein